MIYGRTRIHRKRETNKKTPKKNRRNKFQAASKKTSSRKIKTDNKVPRIYISKE